MKKILAMIMTVLLVVSLVGCSGDDTTNGENSFVDIYKTQAMEMVENGDMDAAIAALEEGVTNTNDDSLKQLLEELKAEKEASKPTEEETVTTVTDAQEESDVAEEFDVSAYVGEWATDGFGWEQGGFHMAISLNESKIDIVCTNVFSSKMVEAELLANTAMVVNGVLTSGFDDSWGNRGIMTLKFENQQIVCTVSDVEYSADGLGYSLGEGEYTLRAYTAPVETTPKGDYDAIMGSYSSGRRFLHIGYQDKTKQQAVMRVELLGETYDMPINGSVDGEMNGLQMSAGSEPRCAVTMFVENSGQINAEIYIGSTGQLHEIIFTPAGAGETETPNPFFVG